MGCDDAMSNAVTGEEKCSKCGATSGGDWSQCAGAGACPMPMSSHYTLGDKQCCNCGEMQSEHYDTEVMKRCVGILHADAILASRLDVEQRADPANYSFCESIYAGPLRPWHIRFVPIGAKRMYGGGIQTGSLCGGVQPRLGWDLDVDITKHHLSHTCGKCAAEYRERTKPDAK